MRAVDVWGIVWIFILLAIAYAVIYYDAVWEKIKSSLKKVKRRKT